MPPLPKLPDFQTLEAKIQVAIVAGVLALIGVGGYTGLVAPKNREIKNLKVQLTREEPDSITAPQPFSPITEEERKLWEQLEARLRERFPADKDLPAALRAVAELARSARMELVSLNLQTPAVKSTGGASGAAASGAANPPPLQIPPPLTLSPALIKLTALHRYGDLVQFLDGLDRLPVAVTVESMEVKRVENHLSTEMTLRTLRWGAS